MSHSLTRIQAIILGAAVLLGVALGGVGVFAVGNQHWLWSDTLHVVVGFPQIRGVEVGTRVRVQGIEAGEVEAVEPPIVPGGDVTLRLRLSGRMRSLVRADASAQIVGEGMLGGKVVEIQPGSRQAPPVVDNARLVSQPANDLAELLGQLHSALQEFRDGQGTIRKLLQDPDAYADMVALLRQSRDTLTSVQQDADALKRLPVVRGYVENPQELLVRPNCQRNRRAFAESELFEPGRSVLTAEGQHRLDDLAPWLAELKHKGSEVVVVAYADPSTSNSLVARTVTKQQSEAVCTYLKSHHAVQKTAWFRWRKVTALGMGTNPPPQADPTPLPSSRVEVLVFVPQG